MIGCLHKRAGVARVYRIHDAEYKGTFMMHSNYYYYSSVERVCTGIISLRDIIGKKNSQNILHVEIAEFYNKKSTTNIYQFH